jgi:hypothetical protein
VHTPLVHSSHALLSYTPLIQPYTLLSCTPTHSSHTPLCTWSIASPRWSR